jgi:hypothetical protein
MWHVGEQRVESIFKAHTSTIFSTCVHDGQILSGDVEGEVRT